MKRFMTPLTDIAVFLVLAIIIAAIVFPCFVRANDAAATAMATLADSPTLTPLDWSRVEPQIDYAVTRGAINETEYGAFAIPVTITQTQTRVIRGEMRFGPDGWGFVADGE